jgi:hypothetical protein
MRPGLGLVPVESTSRIQTRVDVVVVEVDAAVVALAQVLDVAMMRLAAAAEASIRLEATSVASDVVNTAVGSVFADRLAAAPSAMVESYCLAIDFQVAVRWKLPGLAGAFLRQLERLLASVQHGQLAAKRTRSMMFVGMAVVVVVVAAAAAVDSAAVA